ncbi:MAG: hypothetical protein J6Y70_00630 [Bacilli bacterium]|nr:hypothetical protein [Bacilli bacterium]
MDYVVLAKFFNIEPPRFKTSIKNLKINNFVIYDNKIAIVVSSPFYLNKKEITSSMPIISNYAKNNDIEKYKKNIVKSDQILNTANLEAKKNNSDINFLFCQPNYYNNHYILFVSYNKKNNFNLLFKEIESALNMQNIDFQQITPRIRTKIIGDIGTYSKKICCNTFLKTKNLIQMGKTGEKDKTNANNKKAIGFFAIV